MESVLASGIKGLNSALTGTARAASDIVQATTPRVDDSGRRVDSGLMELTESVVDLKTYSRQFEASVRIIEAADDMLGTLFDERA
ncbi:MAG: flagellar biosynthesis protein FlgE [Chromatiales bacterium]|jgi:flagellar hook protein FlgE|nr:flagellar biosynthesis protein FlgE [Chromatiales bacterium]